MMLAPKLRHEQRTEIPEPKTKCKTTKRSSSVEGTCSQSGCGPEFSSSRFGKVDYVLVNMRGWNELTEDYGEQETISEA